MTTPASLFDQMRSRPREFQFVQWIRLWLRQKLTESGPSREVLPLLDDGLEIHNQGSIGFAPQDIAEAQPGGRGRERLLVHFLGLHGASSPLPSFLTEEIDRMRERSAPLREFLNLFDRRLYRLYAMACLHRHPWIRTELSTVDPLDGKIRLWANAPSGAHGGDLTQAARRLGGLSHLRPRGRSSSGLGRFLSSSLGVNTPVKINDMGIHRVPNAQPARLGSTALDGSAAIGSTLDLGGGRVDISIGPVPAVLYKRMVGHKEHWQEALSKTMADYLQRPVPWSARVELDLTTLEPGIGQSLDGTAKLGRMAWLTGQSLQPPHIIFKNPDKSL